MYDRHIGTPRAQGIGLSENSKINARERPSPDSASIRSLLKRLLSTTIVIYICFESIATFTATCLNVGWLIFFKERIKWLLIGFDQDQLSQQIVGHLLRSEIPLHKRIYWLETLDVQMDLPILLELRDVGQQMTCQTSSLICQYLHYVKSVQIRSYFWSGFGHFTRSAFVCEWGLESTLISECNPHWAII